MSEGHVVTLSDYGSIFQSKLLKFLIEDKTFFFRLSDILKPHYLVDKEYKDLYTIIKKHFEKYTELPSYDILKMYTQKVSDPDRKARFQKLINDIMSQDGDREFILDTAYTFCKRNEIKETMIDCITHLENEQYDEIETKFMDLIKRTNIDIDGHNYWENFDRRILETRYNIIPTGWDPLDFILNGGLGAGELGVAAGAPGFGKTHFLVNLAANAAKIGKNALFISMELGSNAIETRIDANYTGIEIDKIKFHKEHVKKELERFKKEEKYGDIFVKYFPTGTVSVQNLKTYTDQLRATGFKPDIILVDYADILKPGRYYKDAHRLEQKGIYEELRGWAGESRTPIWTASQAGKQTVEKDWIGIEDLSESFGKAMVADVIMGLTRKIDQRLDNEGKLFLAKSRVGKDGIIFPLDFDASTSTIIVHSSDDDMTKDILSGVTKANSGRIKMSSRKKSSIIDELKKEFDVK